jgi:hypothetical protein
MKIRTISVKGSEITVSSIEQEDFISLTDIARYKNPNEPIDIIKNWLRNRTTIEFIGLREQLHNPHFKAVEFDRFIYEAGSNIFTLANSKLNLLRAQLDALQEQKWGLMQQLLTGEMRVKV